MACTSRTVQEGPDSQVMAGETENTADMDNEAQQGWDEDLGEKTLRGKMTLTKGKQPMVDGVMLSKDYFGEDWRAKTVALEGKRVEVKGHLWRHHCGPLEQCLSPGYIDRLVEITSLEEL